MSLVLDSSMSLTWCLPGQASLVSLNILEHVKAEGARVPFIWHVEMANILGLKLRDGNLTQYELDQSIRLLGLLKITTQSVQGATFKEMLPIMTRFQLTAYDASYLELAIQTGLQLATFDRAMIAAAIRTGVSLVCET